jgi:hypothetical protein
VVLHQDDENGLDVMDGLSHDGDGQGQDKRGKQQMLTPKVGK